MIGHLGRYNRASYSPDGKQVLTSGYDGRCVVGRGNGQASECVQRAYGSSQHGVVLSGWQAGGDGGCRRHGAGVERGDGRAVSVLHGIRMRRECILQPRWNLVVTASQDHTARLWDAATGKPVGVLSGMRVRSHTLFSSDGKRC